MNDACRQARDRAVKLRRLLGSETIGAPRPVEPLVVLRGRTAEGEFVEPCVVDGVRVVHGTHLRGWAESLGASSPADDGSQAKAKANLLEFLSRRDAYIANRDDPKSWYVRRGIYNPVMDVIVGLNTFVLTFCGSAWLIAYRPMPLVVRLAAITVAWGLGGYALRRKRWNGAAAGWLAGTVCVLLIFLCAAIYLRFR